MRKPQSRHQRVSPRQARKIKARTEEFIWLERGNEELVRKMKSGTNKCADNGQKSRMVKTIDEGASRPSNVKTKQKIETKKGLNKKLKTQCTHPTQLLDLRAEVRPPYMCVG
jgi:hypothetical protein